MFVINPAGGTISKLEDVVHAKWVDTFDKGHVTAVYQLKEKDDTSNRLIGVDHDSFVKQHELKQRSERNVDLTCKICDRRFGQFIRNFRRRNPRPLVQTSTLDVPDSYDIPILHLNKEQMKLVCSMAGATGGVLNWNDDAYRFVHLICWRNFRDLSTRADIGTVSLPLQK
jgi:hypothetical protein